MKGNVRRMKRIIALAVLMTMMLGIACAEWPDLSGCSVEELKMLRSEVDALLLAEAEKQWAQDCAAYYTSPEQFAYVDNGAEVTILGYNGSESVMVIPAEIRGMPVTRIAESAFADNKVIQRAILPDSLVQIGSNAFRACGALQEVNIPASVTTIPDSAFGYCYNLMKVTGLEHVSEIGPRAFAQVKFSEELVFRAQSLSIGYEAFRYSEVPGVRILSDTVYINGSYTFRECGRLQYFYVAPHATLTLDGAIFSQCKTLKIVVLPEDTTVIQSHLPLVEGCQDVVFYTPETSGAYAYCKANFLRCISEEYETMNAIYAENP